MGLYGYFYGVYEPILRGKQDDFWVKLGYIRGLWEILGVLRRFEHNQISKRNDELFQARLCKDFQRLLRS